MNRVEGHDEIMPSTSRIEFLEYLCMTAPWAASPRFDDELPNEFGCQ